MTPDGSTCPRCGTLFDVEAVADQEIAEVLGGQVTMHRGLSRRTCPECGLVQIGGGP